MIELPRYNECNYVTSTTENNRNITNTTAEKQIQVGRSYECFLCPSKFTNIVYLEHHKKQHDTFKCTVCSDRDLIFNSRILYMKHFKSHVKKQIECGFCSQKFYERSEYKTHLSLHTENSMLKCEICSALFSQKSILRQHLLQHTEKVPNLTKFVHYVNSNNASTESDTDTTKDNYNSVDTINMIENEPNENENPSTSFPEKEQISNPPVTPKRIFKSVRTQNKYCIDLSPSGKSKSNKKKQVMLSDILSSQSNKGINEIYNFDKNKDNNLPVASYLSHKKRILENNLIPGINDLFTVNTNMEQISDSVVNLNPTNDDNSFSSILQPSTLMSNPIGIPSNLNSSSIGYSNDNFIYNTSENNLPSENIIDNTCTNHYSPFSETSDISANLFSPSVNTFDSLSPILYSSMVNNSSNNNSKKFFTCSKCQKLSFGTYNALKKHEEIHIRKRGHKCNICGAAFIKQGVLKLHVKRAH